MNEIINPLSAKSYTNKDFQSIYVELLEAAKTLAKNWDPTISNESDPGVVLLKLNAIIADKNNYNIDKNILENYPETYTQDISARSQYKQMGYRMPWYKAATTKVTFKWIGDELLKGDYMTIPAHTMIMDKDERYIFTLLEDVSLGNYETNYTDTDSVNAIQGIINTLKLSGSDNITLSNLDSKNRLYINDQYIAENGIYVTNTSESNGNTWKQVENVNLEPFGTKCYEFDIDPKRNCPYLQFSDSIRNLIGDGITVKYITTNGYDGNISAKVLDSFYDKSSIKLNHSNGESTSVELNSDNFLITNPVESINGQDPESIEAAYNNFRKTICTFDTLVTLRDYINAIYTFGKNTNELSNIIVTDRTTDIQSRYRIIDKNDSLLGYVEHFVTNPGVVTFKATPENKLNENDDIYIEEHGTFTPSSLEEVKNNNHTAFIREDCDSKDMNAFDIKFYILKTGGLLNDVKSFNQSFEIDTSENTLNAIKAYIQSSKSVQHDIVPIKNDVPFMLQNIYPINIKLVPTFKLNQVAQEELITNIKSKLIQVLNSRNCEFGKEPSYDIIYNEIVNCDERIKVLILDDFKYTTFAVYMGHYNDDVDGELELKYIPISDYSNCSRLIVKNLNQCGNCGNPIMVSEAEDNSDSISIVKEKLQEAADKILTDESNDSKDNIKPTEKQIASYRFIDSTHGIMYCWRSTGSSKIKLYSDRLLDIRKEVIAKNILAGVTPLFDYEDQMFDTTLNMNQISNMSGEIDNIKTNLEVAPFGFDAQYDPTRTSATYKLRANEILKFTAPSFISDRTYANYVKFELVLKDSPSSANQYAWADPQNSEELIKTHTANGFYRKTSENTYHPINCISYQPLNDLPQFKLLYFKRTNQGSGLIHDINTNDIISNFNNVNQITIPEIEENKFETYMYYKLENSKFNVINGFYPEFDSDLKAGKLYRLKQYHKGYVGVDISNIENSELILGDYYLFSDGSYQKITLNNVGDISSIESTGTNVYMLSNICDYFNNNISDPYTKCSISDNPTDIDGTFSDNSTNYRFELALPYHANIYLKILDNSGNVVGYKLVESVDSSNFEDNDTLEALLKYAYQRVLFTEGKPVPEFEDIDLNDVLSRVTVAKIADYKWTEDTLKNYSIKYMDTSANHSVVTYKTPSAPTDFTKVSCYKKMDDGEYKKIEKDSPDTFDIYESTDWVNNYHKYYSRNNDSGLLENTTEYTQWKNGLLSLYVKEASFKLPANTEYQLRDGDHITFFWRSVDEDDAPYTYRHYNHVCDNSTDQPTIIKASFPIKASIGTGKFFNHKTFDPPSGEIPYSGDPNSIFQKISTKMYDEYDLSGSRQIDIRKLNTVKIDSSNNKYYYLISAKKSKSTEDKDIFKMIFNYKSTWTDSKSNQTYAKYQRILQAGEYFSYLNGSRTLFEIVGEGTLVEYNVKIKNQNSEDLKNTTKELTNIALDINDIHRRGIEALKEGCTQISSDELINVIEQQIYSFVKDDVVQITLTEENRPIYRIAQENETATHLYHEQNAQYIPIDEASEDDKKNLTRYVQESIPIYPVFSSNIPVSLEGYNVTYSSASNNNNKANELDLVYTSLPSINLLDKDYNWQVTAHLNINCDSSTAQRIEVGSNDNKSRQSITILDTTFPYYDENGKPHMNEKDTTELKEDYDELYLLTSVPLDKVGSEYIDVTYQDLLGDRHNINSFVYQLNNNSINSENNWEVVDSGLLLRLEKDGNNPTLEVTREIKGLSLSSNHRYLLPIIVPKIFELEGNTFSISSNEDLKCLCCNDTQLSPGRHYVELSSSITDININIKIKTWETISEETTPSVNIIFEKLFKYNYRSIFGADEIEENQFEEVPKYGITTPEIIKKIQELDVNNNFKYTHIPTIDELISDPLDPISLFNDNHVYNKFSIARAEIDNGKPFDASFDIVNNK